MLCLRTVAGYWIRAGSTTGPDCNVTTRQPQRVQWQTNEIREPLSSACADHGVGGLLNSHFFVYAADHQSRCRQERSPNNSVDFRYPMDSSVTRALFKFRRCATAHGDVVNKTPSSSWGIGRASSDGISRCVSLDFSFDGLFTEIWGTAVTYTVAGSTLFMSVSLFTGFFIYENVRHRAQPLMCAILLGQRTVNKQKLDLLSETV
jgi:hypothetical protein